MFKLRTSTGQIVKSFDIYDLFEFIINSKGETFEFFLGYYPITHNDFSKLFLTETRNTEQYILIESSLNPRIDLIDYEKTKK